ncbi:MULTISPECIES: P-type conjugative transfer protein TrbJ [Thiomonas]|uniref:P-type conjugative transfer protein TrbJ n=2 Tax=Thiomonas arsenitoxydans (strain DSM 22701 / CIP 110005 / 3As) TaxID=426114 RepID=A0A8I1MX69_THIA3|nr:MULTISPECIES: P-type conjugative transfer protein TrbJ [Thiomonas]CQR44765.1 P-type conjugative transfer protein TrbJ [Thiomonas sp. CB3]MBN8744612.1 P-type conjugative transfer protein TrbJ [Thiomonas arsenitoxydans]ODU96102.1 MAG: P-type conjugative transfer protein TrbJ [Thiomonas sp. SCN 64-16]CDW92537.1 P-type conjugative transfer protein TrbJ [Thiomonas sp. CB2]SCC91924.1 P-type conjugative transfer protein TrbJ [Thiomonas sp. X19]
MNLKKSTLALAAIAALASTPAHATGMIAGATFPEQIVQELTLVEQYATQAQQLQAQFQQVYNQAVNMQNIPAQLWPNISGQLQNLVNLVGNAKGLSYAAANTVSAVQTQFGQPSAVLSNYNASLQTWTGNLDSQIADVLKQYGLNASNFQTTQSALASIQAQSQSAGGRKAVMQAGNQISALMVNQMQGLQSDIQAGNQAMLNYMAMQAHTQVNQSNSVTPILTAPTGPGAF